jgi:drug/metabolite transporter (DMT)-like permease
VTNGILLALLAYASFSWGDAAIKAIGGGLSVFEIGFFSTLFAGFFFVFAKPRDERWAGFWKMERPLAVQARALSGIAAGMLGIYAFTTIPLAEAYSLIFMSPLFVTILSILVLGERVGPWRWLAVAAGFVGVLLVVQPGFRDLQLGHLAAALIAVLAAITVILLRSLAREKRTSVLGVMIVYGLIFNGVAALFTSFRVPAPAELGLLALVGIFSGIGQIAILLATRFTDANRIAPTHYSQMLWAVGLGALVFGEYPGPLALLGMAVIGASGLLTLVRENVRLGRVRWNPFRNRL